VATWERPPEAPHAGAHGVPPPHHAHFWHGKPPHEHLYAACEAILMNMQELSERLAAIEQRLGRVEA
jgi:hypothetical protein